MLFQNLIIFLKAFREESLSSISTHLQSELTTQNIKPQQENEENKENDLLTTTQFLTLLALFKYYQNVSDSRHFGICCDTCGKNNFKGDRYKCLVCKDYDLCDECYENNKISHQHQIFHTMLLIEIPIKQETNKEFNLMILNNTIQQQFSQQLHIGIECIGCNQSPIEGIRLKCYQCTEYDFCWSCWKDKKEKKQHKVNHKILAFLQPTQEKFDIENEIEYLDDQSDSKSGCFGSVRKGRLIQKNKVFQFPDINQIVAVKKIQLNEDEEENLNRLKQSFVNERRALKELRCSKIIKYYGWGEESLNDCQNLYIISEYMPGGSLQDAIEQKGDYLSLRRKLQIAQEIAEGIKIIHDKNFVHKDLKPDNILLDSKDETPSVKIGDMGISIPHKGYEENSKLCPRNFQPPEFHILSDKYSNKVDIYQFGLTFNFLLTGQLHKTLCIMPFNFNQAILPKAPIFSELIERCISDDPDKRPCPSEIIQTLKDFDSYFWCSLKIPQQQYIRCSKQEKDQILIQSYENYITDDKD